MSAFDDNEDEDGFFAKNKLWISLAAIAALGGGGWHWFTNKEKKPEAPKQERIVMVSLPPPPPPPPPKPKPTPPPVQEPPKEQKIEDKKVMDDAPKAEAPKPEPAKAPDEPPPSMGSNIKGDGPDSFGLSGSGNGGFVGLGGNGNGKRGGSGYGAYGLRLKSRVVESLKKDKRTRSASFDLINVKVWLDDSGRVTRADPISGDREIALALVGLQGDPPPNGIPMPITVKFSGRRP